MSARIESSYRAILNSARSSGLHFCLQETPYSCYITVRKSLINPNASHVFVPDQSSTRLKETSEVDQIKSRNFFLENSNVKISQSYQYAIEELEERAQSIGSLKSEIKNLTAELKKAYDENDKVVQVKVKAFKEEKKSFAG